MPKTNKTRWGITQCEDCNCHPERLYTYAIYIASFLHWKPALLVLHSVWFSWETMFSFQVGYEWEVLAQNTELARRTHSRLPEACESLKPGPSSEGVRDCAIFTFIPEDHQQVGAGSDGLVFVQLYRWPPVLTCVKHLCTIASSSNQLHQRICSSLLISPGTAFILTQVLASHFQP